MSTPQQKQADPHKVDQIFQEHRRQSGGEIPLGIGNVLNAVVGDPEKGLTKIEDFTTFLAEYVFRDGDIILHFFLTKEWGMRPESEWRSYWERLFPAVLSPVAENFFDATLPRIFAEYVPEMRSWYFQANGFASCIDPKALLMQFLEKLDEALDKVNVVPG